MEQKSNFKRYVLIDIVNFDKIKNSFVSNKHLNDVERKLLKILRDKSLSASHRMFMYQQILFNEKAKGKESSSIVSTQTEEPIAFKRIKEVEEKNSLLNQNLKFPSTPLRKPITSTPTQTKILIKKNTATQFEPPEVFTNSDTQDSQVQEKTFSDDDLQTFDLSKEREDFINAIRNEIGSVNLNDLSFRHLDDATKNYVQVETPEGITFPIEKSDALLLRQKKQKQSVKRLQASKPSPLEKKSPRKLRSAVKKENPYTSYEHMSNNQNKNTSFISFDKKT